MNIPLFCSLRRYRVDLLVCEFRSFSLFDRLSELRNLCFQVFALLWIREFREALLQRGKFIGSQKVRSMGRLGFCQSAQLLLKVLNLPWVLFFCELLHDLFDLSLFCGYREFPLNHFLVDFAEFVP